MSVLYLHFEAPERDARVQKLARSGAHIVVAEPRWPGFFELAKKEKPYAIAVDFSHAPSHALETADYLAKAKETRDTAIFLLRVPQDRLDAVAKRLPKAPVVTEPELSVRLVEAERREQQRAQEKKEAAAEARKLARAKKAEATKPAPTKAKLPSRPKKALPAKKAKPKKLTGKKKATTKKKAAGRKGAARPKK